MGDIVEKKNFLISYLIRWNECLFPERPVVASELRFPLGIVKLRDHTLTAP